MLSLDPPGLLTGEGWGIDDGDAAKLGGLLLSQTRSICRFARNYLAQPTD